MKTLFKYLIALFILVAMVTVGAACVDIDEALPHYNQHDNQGPQK